MFHFLVLIVALFGVFFLLGKVATVVIHHTDLIGRRYRIPEFFLGFVILGFATSTPELFIGIHSTLLKTAQISVGNLLGGVFLLLTLFLGGVAVVNRGVQLTGLVSRPILLGVTFVFLTPLVVVFDGVITRSDGVSLIILYFIAVLLLAYESYREESESLVRKFWSVFIRGEKAVVERVEEVVESHGEAQDHRSGRSFVFLLLGIGGLLVLTRVALDLGLSLARFLSFGPFVVGAIFFSLGTNLPELTLAVTARRLQKQALSLGNIIGSALTNIFLLGFFGTLGTIRMASLPSLRLTILFLLAALILFFFSASTGRHITRREGIAHIVLYCAFLLTQFLLLGVL